MRKLTNSDIRLATYTIGILFGYMILTNIFPGIGSLLLFTAGVGIGYYIGLWKSGKL